MKHRAALAVIAGSVAWSLSLAGCGSARRGEPLYEPPRIDTPSERHGERVFFEFCHQCHPQGQAGLGPAINNKPVPDTAIRIQVREGLGAMPSFSKRDIDDRGLDDLLAYLHTLRKAEKRRK